MSKKTIEHAVDVLRDMKEEIYGEFIKDSFIFRSFDFEKARETGFAVSLTLSTGDGFHSTILEMWRKWLEAEEYVVSVSQNQLRITFNVMY